MPRLLARRLLWLPTLPALLLLFALLGSVAVLLARQANEFFALNEPLAGRPGQATTLLVVEGWMGEDDLRQVLAAVRAGDYAQVVTIGGPIASWGSFPSHAERAADYLRRGGLPARAVPTITARTERTYTSALAVRSWARREGIEISGVDVYSPGVHARRSLLLQRMAWGPGVTVGVRSTQPAEYDAARWWTSSEGTKSLLNEGLSLAWTKCCFWPPAPSSARPSTSTPSSAPTPQ